MTKSYKDSDVLLKATKDKLKTLVQNPEEIENFYLFLETCKKGKTNPGDIIGVLTILSSSLKTLASLPMFQSAANKQILIDFAHQTHASLQSILTEKYKINANAKLRHQMGMLETTVSKLNEEGRQSKLNIKKS